MTSDPEPAVARPRVAAGVLFFDRAGRLLMVVPSYQDHLNIPGGYVDPGESPLAAARREIREELGIDPPVGRLLAVDWAQHGDGPEDPHAADVSGKLIFLFDGGTLAPELQARIRVDGDEITAYELHPVDELAAVTIPAYTRRIGQGVAARADGSTRYLEDGRCKPEAVGG
jgi:8-oxo-dGTP diphosphatase